MITSGFTSHEKVLSTSRNRLPYTRLRSNNQDSTPESSGEHRDEQETGTTVGSTSDQVSYSLFTSSGLSRVSNFVSPEVVGRSFYLLKKLFGDSQTPTDGTRVGIDSLKMIIASPLTCKHLKLVRRHTLPGERPTSSLLDWTSLRNPQVSFRVRRINLPYERTLRVPVCLTSSRLDPGRPLWRQTSVEPLFPFKPHPSYYYLSTQVCLF